MSTLLHSRRLGLGLAAVLFLIGGVAVIPAETADDLNGRYEAEGNGDQLWLQLRYLKSHSFSSSLPARSFRRVGEGRTELRREAGAFLFRGLDPSAAGRQAGEFRFRPDPGYVAAMAERGHRGLDGERLFELASIDLTLAFVDELAALGYRESLERLFDMRIHGVDAPYIRDLASAGYRDLPAKKLLEMRIHGVDVAYVRDLAAAGYGGLTAERLVQMKIHGVDGGFISALADAGYRDLAMRDVMEMRIHGVQISWVRELAQLGYGDLSARRLIEMRIHGVGPTWIRELQSLGYGSDVVTVSELVEMRIHGVDPGWIRGQEPSGISPRRLIENRLHGG
ncbi:MAG: hypothetical protein AAFY88_11605 [Acidobacteriota bacterium]